MRGRLTLLGACLALTCRTAAQGAQTSDVPAGLRCLQSAYPDFVCDATQTSLVLCDGRLLPWDDGKSKTHAARIEDADLEDMMAEPYDAQGALPPPPDIEPGRVRYSPLFDAMYGSTPAQVRAKLTRVDWLGHKVDVTIANGVDTRLRAVAAELDQLPASLHAQVARTAGTFNFRAIAGTERKSAHSYGIAIDVAPQLGDYWRWREPEAPVTTRYRSRMPIEVVRAFERAGFIWGGRWNHYDTMHFEYRPELFVSACQMTRTQTTETRATQPASYTWLSAPSQQSLRERIAPPLGYHRVELAANSFGAWLRDLPLKPGRGLVKLFNGEAKALQTQHVAIVDIDTGSRDLQQCADAVMRLRAEYLFASDRRDEICFHAASGDVLPYASYRRGLRPPRGRGSPWTPQSEPDASWPSFRRYLDLVFGIANTASLARELEPVRDMDTITAGDVYIESARGNRYGHAVTVLDVAESAAGERVFLIAQSYMPAQDIHILLNPRERELGPWYRAPSDGSLETPEWSFPAASLKRFAASCAR